MLLQFTFFFILKLFPFLFHILFLFRVHLIKVFPPVASPITNQFLRHRVQLRFERRVHCFLFNHYCPFRRLILLVESIISCRGVLEESQNYTYIMSIEHGRLLVDLRLESKLFFFLKHYVNYYLYLFHRQVDNL